MENSKNTQTVIRDTIIRPEKISFKEINIFSNESGKDLFFLVIETDNNGLGGFWVKRSTDYSKAWKRYNSEDVNAVVSEVIFEIINTPNVECSYFHELVLTKNGKLCKEIYDIREEEWIDGFINEPITKNCNTDKFLPIANEDILKKMDESDIEISRAEFEKYLVTERLKDEYVNNYDIDCRFFSSITHDNEEMKLVIKNNHVIMFFRNK